MGEEKGPDFYDQHLERMSIPLESSPWLEVYRAAAELLPKPPASPIVDIGCGTGRFARLLYDRGYREYWGFDFSTKRVGEAKRYVPALEFSVANVLDPSTVSKLQEFSLAVCLEVLEHIISDREVLASLPVGCRVILSVPNYDSRAHVRTFEGFDAIRARYGDLILFEPGSERTFPRKKTWKRIFLVAGQRR